MNDMQAIVSLLQYRRPAGSRTERQFIREHLSPLGLKTDKAGNLYKRIGKDSPVMWSCHTDTVHTKGGMQRLLVKDGIVTTASPDSNCLGADDTAGIWLMSEMIRADVPGLYVFHRGEEIGGVGSTYIATRFPELLERTRFAIAFDRRGAGSIITHQGSRCCSDAFADSLSDALGLGHAKDSTGTFTDTANYTELVGECTNVSAGYANEHHAIESLDTSYLITLRDALLSFDETRLVASRAPGEVDDEDWGVFCGAHQEPRGWQSNYDQILAMCRDNPLEVADWLEEHGVSAFELSEAVLDRGGVIRKAVR